MNVLSTLLLLLFHLVLFSQNQFDECFIAIEDVIEHNTYKAKVNLTEKNWEEVRNESKKGNSSIGQLNYNFFTNRNQVPMSFTMYGDTFEFVEEKQGVLRYASKPKSLISKEIDLYFAQYLSTEMPKKMVVWQNNLRNNRRRKLYIWHFYGYN